jgi:hypothetical protein
LEIGQHMQASTRRALCLSGPADAQKQLNPMNVLAMKWLLSMGVMRLHMNRICKHEFKYDLPVQVEMCVPSSQYAVQQNNINAPVCSV